MFTLPEHLLSLPFFIAHSAHVPLSNFLYSVLPILLIWLFVLLLAIVLSVHQFTASRHPFGIYKRLLHWEWKYCYNNFIVCTIPCESHWKCGLTHDRYHISDAINVLSICHWVHSEHKLLFEGFLDCHIDLHAYSSNIYQTEVITTIIWLASSIYQFIQGVKALRKELMRIIRHEERFMTERFFPFVVTYIREVKTIYVQNI
jgi:hypothetical protein